VSAVAALVAFPFTRKGRRQRVESVRNPYQSDKVYVQCPTCTGTFTVSSPPPAVKTRGGRADNVCPTCQGRGHLMTYTVSGTNPDDVTKVLTALQRGHTGRTER
jgi:transcription elongation factor Elf1